MSRGVSGRMGREWRELHLVVEDFGCEDLTGFGVFFHVAEDAGADEGVNGGFV